MAKPIRARSGASESPDLDVDLGPVKGPEASRLLRVLGIMNPDGTVSADNRRKLKQVAHLVPLLVRHMESTKIGDRVDVVDLNCGNAYLGFMVRAALASTGADVRVLGVDRNPERIDTCRRRARSLGLTGMDFETGDASTYPIPQGPFAVVSLHGCDTATDDALRRGVESGATHILAVPCCHREVRGLLSESVAANAFIDDGILASDYAACLTDALRALWLRAKGYRTEIVEFVSWEHTPKNRLLRARIGLSRAESTSAHARFLAASESLRTAPSVLRSAL